MKLHLRMSHGSGAVPERPLTAEEEEVRVRLVGHVATLAGAIGFRHVERYDALEAAALYVERELRAAGHAPRAHPFQADGHRVRNIDVVVPGTRRPDEIIVIGAHYDSAPSGNGGPGSPGANDNASGVAALLALARRRAGRPAARTLRFVAFTNEEDPYYLGPEMGSFVYASACRARGDSIVGMLSLETMGYFSQEPRSQGYPLFFSLLYPTTANFIAFVGNVEHGALVEEVGAAFRRACDFPCLGLAVPQFLRGVEASDHSSFWRQGYPALMVTDTANFRYRQFHSPDDTADRLCYPALARVVVGLDRAVEELAGR